MLTSYTSNKIHLKIVNLLL